MVLTNAQRQALYRQRRQERAAKTVELSAGMADLLTHYRRLIAGLQQQVDLMEAYQRGEGGFGTHGPGFKDTTAESVKRTRAQIADLEAIVAKYDPTP